MRTQTQDCSGTVYCPWVPTLSQWRYSRVQSIRDQIIVWLGSSRELTRWWILPAWWKKLHVKCTGSKWANCLASCHACPCYLRKTWNSSPLMSDCLDTEKNLMSDLCSGRFKEEYTSPRPTESRWILGNELHWSQTRTVWLLVSSGLCWYHHRMGRGIYIPNRNIPTGN